MRHEHALAQARRSEGEHTTIRLDPRRTRFFFHNRRRHPISVQFSAGLHLAHAALQ
jgi:hypothetical protein